MENKQNNFSTGFFPNGFSNTQVIGQVYEVGGAEDMLKILLYPGSIVAIGLKKDEQIMYIKSPYGIAEYNYTSKNIQTDETAQSSCLIEEKLKKIEDQIAEFQLTMDKYKALLE